jgi:hypothetical protein
MNKDDDNMMLKYIHSFLFSLMLGQKYQEQLHTYAYKLQQFVINLLRLLIFVHQDQVFSNEQFQPLLMAFY